MAKNIFVMLVAAVVFMVKIRVYPNQRIGSVTMFNRSGMKYERFLDKVGKFYFNDNIQCEN